MNKNLFTLTLVVLCGLQGCSSPKERGGGREATEHVLVVVEKGAHAIGFYTEGGKRLGGVPVGKLPHEMVFSPDRKLAYVTDNGSFRFRDEAEGGNTVSVIDLQARKRLKTISLGRFRRPHGISLDPMTGLLAVSVENPDRLLLIEPAEGKIVGDYDVKGTTPHMVTLAPGAKRAYVMNAESATVAAIDLQSKEVTLIPMGENPQGAVLSRDGKELYVTCQEYVAVVGVESLKEVARIGKGANRIVLTQDGSLLIYSSGLPGVGFADPKTREVLHHLDLPYKPFSLNLSSDETQVYVGAEEQDIIYVISVAQRKVVREIPTREGVRPDPVMDIQAPSRKPSG